MDDRRHSISANALYARLGSKSAPIIVDVRRDADCAGADALVADTFHHSPNAVDQWRTDLPNGRQVVLPYCFHGREVSQSVAAALRLMEVEARGGIAGRTEQGLSTRRNIGASPAKWVARERSYRRPAEAALEPTTSRQRDEGGISFMRSFAMVSLMLIGFCGLNVAAQAQSSCKVCGEQQRACMKNYPGPTCKTEYQMCMKSCGKKS